jgi:anthranilate phosphoribosyltransferase
MSLLKELLKPMTEVGTTLTREQSRTVLRQILAGEVPDVEVAALLTTMATRGETYLELTGFAEIMREQAVPIPMTDAERSVLVDTVGTGGGGPSTFNISSAAALISAAAGAQVAKHGNRAVTSKCGSADVLESLGIPIDLDPQLAVECLRETGFMFLLATKMHPAMKQVGPLRRALGFSTIFNLCGPLTNPAAAPYQVIGVLAPSRVLLLGRALATLGTERSFVVHGTDGLDEMTIFGETIVARVEAPVPLTEHPEKAMRASRMTPEMAGLTRLESGDITGGDAKTNAAILVDILTGVKGPRREIALLNTAATLVACGMAADLKEGVAKGAEAIDSGQAVVVLEKLRRFKQKYAGKSA